MSSFSLFRHHLGLHTATGIQPGIGCGAQKVVLASKHMENSVVHHMRQTYVDTFPNKDIAELNYIIGGLLAFVREPENIAKGDVPACWQEAVARGLL